MRKVGFIGGYEKTDLIIYIAKILTAMDKKVLVIDATTLQKARYTVPTISPAKSYITDFEGIDVAVGFYNFETIKNYLGMPNHAAFEYEYILLDIDTMEAFENFDIKTAWKNYFVTGFDLYSIKKGFEIIEEIAEPIPLTKIFFSKNITKEEDDYFNHIALGYKVIWNEEKIYFPYEQGDQTVIMGNQRIAKIKFKKLTQLYKESLAYVAEELLDNPNESMEFKKVIKQLNKGV